MLNKRHRDFQQDQVAALEPMEPRLLMSGDVWVGVVHGSLVIRGDISSNHIVIDQAGLAAGQFRITGQDGTKVDGQNLRIVSGVTKDVRIGLGDGVDVLEMAGVAVSRDLTIRGGHSGDTFTVTDGSVGRNVNINAGQGDNTTTIDGTTVSGRLDVSGGYGTDALTLTGDASVAGRVSFRPGYGESTCTINQASVGRLWSSGRGSASTTLTGATVGGGVTLRNYEGQDSLSINGNSSIDGNLLVDNGNGGSSSTILSSSIDGDVRIVNGEGMDTVLMDIVEGTDDLVAITGHLRISNHNGGSDVNIAYVDIGGDVRLLGQLGDDVVKVASVGIAGRTQVSLGDGKNQVRMGLSRFEGNVSVLLGNNDDLVNIGEGGPIHSDSSDHALLPFGAYAQFLHPVNIRLGGGADSLYLNYQTPAANLPGGIQADGGEGVDHLYTGLSDKFDHTIIGIELTDTWPLPDENTPA